MSYKNRIKGRPSWAPFLYKLHRVEIPKSHRGLGAFHVRREVLCQSNTDLFEGSP